MKYYTVEDFKGIEIQENPTPMDVLAAVASRIRKKEFPNDSRSTKRMKNEKLLERNKLVYLKELKINKKKSNNGFYERTKKRSSSNVQPVISPELPEEFRIPINELNGGIAFTGEIKLLAEKTLFEADIQDRQNRLSLPLSYMKCNDFLRPDEKIHLETRLGKNKHKHSYMNVRIIEPLLAQGVVKLCIWEHSSLSYVLNGSWKDIVKRNGLKARSNVQLWGFRIGEELCFALRKLPSSLEENSSS